MYEMKYGDYLKDTGRCVYHPNKDTYDIYDMSFDFGIEGDAGTLEMTLTSYNPSAEMDLNDPENFLECYHDGELFWRGIAEDREYSGSDGLEGKREMTFVGELSLLTDVPCPAYSLRLDSGQQSATYQLVDYLLSYCNEWWASQGMDWRIQTGRVDDFNIPSITKENDGDDDDSTVYSELYDYFVESSDDTRTALGACMFLRYTDAGVFLDILQPDSEYFQESNQPAWLGINIEDDDFTFSEDVTEQYACIEPKGASLSDTNYDGIIFSSYSRVTGKPADWEPNYSDYSVRRVFSPLTSEPSDWQLEDGYDTDGNPLGWRKYYALSFTSSKPSDVPSTRFDSSNYGAFRRLDWSGWGFKNAPTFLENAGKNNTKPDGKYAPVYWEAVIDDPTHPEGSAEEAEAYGETFTSIDGDVYTKLSKKPGDWNDSYSNYYYDPDTYKSTAMCPVSDDDGDTGEWTTYTERQPQGVEQKYDAITNGNYKSLTGRAQKETVKVRKKNSKGKYVTTTETHRSWDQGSDPIWSDAYRKVDGKRDPIHGCTTDESYESLTESYGLISTKPAGWVTKYSDYYVKAKDRDKYLYPDGTEEYYSVPTKYLVTEKPKKWADDYSDYSCFDGINGEYVQIPAWQIMSSKSAPSDWPKNKTQWKKKFDDIKSKYAEYKHGSFETLGDLYTKNKYQKWEADRFYKKKTPTTKMKNKRLWVKFTFKYKGFKKGEFYEVFDESVPDFKKNTYYKKTTPAWASGKYYWPHAGGATWKANTYWTQGDEKAPAFPSEPVYTNSDSGDAKLDLRAEWFSDSRFSTLGEMYGYEKHDRIVCSPAHYDVCGARVTRVTYSDAKTFEELAQRCIEDLPSKVRCAYTFEVSALDLSPAEDWQIPSGWPETLDWFRPGIRIPVKMNDFGIDTTALCTSMSGVDFTDPSSGKMTIGGTVYR